MRLCLAIAALATLLVGCNCTDAGCIGYVAFDLRDGTTAPAAFEATYREDGGALKSICCEAPYEACDGGHENRCYDGGFRIASGATMVEVTVTSTRGSTFSGTVEPEYESYRPNGPLCNPECHGAVIALELM